MDAAAMTQAVRRWYEAVREQALRDPEPVSVHLDALLRAGYKREEAVVQGIGCFKALHACWRDSEIVPVLLISLQGSAAIECSAPEWSDAQRLLDDAPPLLIVMRPMVNWLSSPDEEYRCPVQVPADAQLPQGCVSFFRSHRSADERVMGEDFLADLCLTAAVR